MDMKHYLNTSLIDIDGEIWKDVKGFDGYYSISNFGRVKANEREITTKNGVRTRKALIMKQQIKIRHGLYKGFLQVIFSVNGSVYTQKVHQLVGRAFLRKLNPDEVYYRIDGDFQNNTDNNIGITTRAGTSLFGAIRANHSKNYLRKVTKDMRVTQEVLNISLAKVAKYDIKITL